MKFLALTFASLFFAPFAFAQIVLPVTPKHAEFNVPVNFSNIPSDYFTKIDILCAVYSSTNPPAIAAAQSSPPIAGGRETVNLTNGGFVGTVKVKFLVPATDVAKVKSWLCHARGSGPAFSEFNLSLWPTLPDAAKPKQGTVVTASVSGTYD